jgi:beta-galactosidase
MDLFRLPKFSYFLYQSQRDPNILIPGLDSGPMVFIANRWTSDSPTDVKVFSTCEKVRLSLDGVELATQSPDTGQPYLLHPPFTFPSVAFRPGTLKAEGLIGGVVKASYSAGTPGAAATIDVAFDTCGVNPVADGADSVIVHAYVRDGGGALVTTDNRTPVSFGVAGPAIIVGANPAVAEAGIASVLVRTTRAPGTITVTAAAGGLSSGSAGVESVVVTDLIVPDKK